MTSLTPNFEYDIFSIEDFKKDAEQQIQQGNETTKHNEILNSLLDFVTKIDYKKIAFPQVESIIDEEAEPKIKQKHYVIITIEQVIELAQANNWGICKHHDFVYLYNGAYWALFDTSELQVFFGKASEKMGVSKWDARHYAFREQLYKQFLAVANLPKPEQPNATVFINLKNGTFEISPEKQELRPPDRKDFITYQLPFEFNPKAIASYVCKIVN